MKTLTKKRWMTLQRREIVWGFLFISPWLVGITVFFLFNLIEAIVFSFNTIIVDPVVGGFTLEFVGLDNFRFILLEHGSYNQQLVDSLVEMLVNVPLIIFFSLLMAVLLNRKFMARGLVRAVFFLPVIMATTAIQSTLELTMGMMMGGVSSVPTEVMQAQAGFNAASIAMLITDFGVPVQIAQYIISTIAALHEIIRASGVQILIFLAALQAIPPSMYEVCQIEGATGYETFWKVTIPMVSPLILTNVVYTIVDTFAQSQVVQTAHNQAFTMQQFGVSAAMSLISSLLACLLLLLVGWIISKRVFYYN
ncbi:MAG: sugar ABC transporter permease [Defluviitaleaceae bacterium]|nr:sugar ABC transporter permease [Defluviitaleaceae bacterium]